MLTEIGEQIPHQGGYRIVTRKEYFLTIGMASGRSFRLLQPHAWPAAISGNELDAGGFEGGADRGESAGLQLLTIF